MEAARIESKEVICTCVRELLERTGVKANDISILVINCSLFSPTPSLCSMVANEFNMRPDLLSYNLSGMVGAYIVVFLMHVGMQCWNYIHRLS